MIENKELGLKIAENPTEALWAKIKESTNSRIKQIEESLIIEKAFLEMSEEKAKILADLGCYILKDYE